MSGIILTKQESEIIKRVSNREKITIATAESLTCGNIQAAIGAISGASDFFRGGITAYNIDVKVSLLGVDRIHAAKVNCVSSRVAYQMAQGACKLLDSDLSLSTTGYAEIPNADADYNFPHAYFSLWSRDLNSVVKAGLVKKLGDDLVIQHIEENFSDANKDDFTQQMISGFFQLSLTEREKMQYQVSRAALLALVDYLGSY